MKLYEEIYNENNLVRDILEGNIPSQKKDISESTNVRALDGKKGQVISAENKHSMFKPGVKGEFFVCKVTNNYISFMAEGGMITNRLSEVSIEDGVANFGYGLTIKILGNP